MATGKVEGPEKKSVLVKTKLKAKRECEDIATRFYLFSRFSGSSHVLGLLIDKGNETQTCVPATPGPVGKDGGLKNKEKGTDLGKGPRSADEAGQCFSFLNSATSCFPDFFSY